MKKHHQLIVFCTVLIGILFGNNHALAERYVIDTKGQHAFIQFKVSHLGYSYVLGSFPDFSGTFEYDESDPNAATIRIEIDTRTVETSHAERNKHLRGKDFLDVAKYPTATFVSTGYEERGDGTGLLVGNLTLHGVTQPVSIDVKKIGSGKDPWGGYRQGFEGTTTLTMADFDMNYNLGPASRTVDLYLVIEGIRQ